MERACYNYEQKLRLALGTHFGPAYFYQKIFFDGVNDFSTPYWAVRIEIPVNTITPPESREAIHPISLEIDRS